MRSQYFPHCGHVCAIIPRLQRVTVSRKLVVNRYVNHRFCSQPSYKLPGYQFRVVVLHPQPGKECFAISATTVTYCNDGLRITFAPI